MEHQSNYRSDGHGELAKTGVALCHGFTGSPTSLLAWAEHLQEQGFTVNMPLLSGHGTSWQDLSTTPWQRWYQDIENAYNELTTRCEKVYVAGLSMGGALSLRVAALNPVAGVVLVNPALSMTDKRASLAPVLKHLIKSVPSIGNDIKAAGVDENAYPRTPTAAVHELAKLLSDVKKRLPQVTADTLVFRSTVDRVVPDSSIELLRKGIGTQHLEVVPLTNSYHVATMDNDAPQIFAQSSEFFRKA